MRNLLIKKEMFGKELEEKTGIDRDRWNNLRREKPISKARAEEVEAICKAFPEYAYWIATGKTIPEAGQISPELEETRQKLKQAG